MSKFNDPIRLAFDEPCTLTNWCWTSKTFYGIYSISCEDGKYHCGLDWYEKHWEKYDIRTLEEAKDICFDHHKKLLKTCYDDIEYFYYFER